MSDYEKYLIPDGTEDITLPSGMKAKLRHPTINYYLGMGTLPGKMAMILDGGKPTLEGVTGDDLNQASLLLLCDVFVEPRFSTTLPPSPGTLSILRLRIQDFNTVLRWANAKIAAMYDGGGGGADLETFRQEPRAGTNGSSGGETVGGTPELLVPASSTPAG